MSNPATGNTYTLGGVLNEIMGQNIRAFPIMFRQFPHIAYAFFDIKQLAGEGGLTLKPKEIPGIEYAETVDGVSVKWVDYALFDFSTTITTGQSTALSGGILAMTGLADTSGFAVNDRIQIVTDSSLPLSASNEFDGIITAIDSSTAIHVQILRLAQAPGNSTTAGFSTQTITTSSATASTAQYVQRIAWIRNDNDEITRSSQLYNYTEYQSYIQHFSKRIEFTKAATNVVYKYESDAKTALIKKFSYQIGIMFQEVNKTIYKGMNLAPGVGANAKMEMMGLEYICNTCNTVVDLSTSTKPLYDLNNQFELAFQAGSVLGNEPMMMVVNDKFITEINKTEREKIRYDKPVTGINFEIPTLTTAYGSVQMVRDPVLTKLYNYPVAFIFPRSLIKLWVRENQDFEPLRGISRADQSIRVFEVKHNIHEKRLFDLEFELGMIAGGLSLGSLAPFRMIKNFSAV